MLSIDTAPSRYAGTVLAVQANYYWVQLDTPDTTKGEAGEPPLASDLPTSQPLLCTRRARLKKTGQQVMVGDRVQVEEPDWTGGRGAIAQVMPRQTQLDRPPVANADQILLMFAFAEPALDVYQLSRFLVKAEFTGLKVTLCLNKRDLVSDAVFQAWQQRLEGWGYQPIILSVQTDNVPSSTIPTATGWATLKGHLSHHITVVSGPSGVGKSSLINRLIPQVDLRTSTVSGKLGRGRHTTRHVELFELPTGGLLADTPGFNQPDLLMSPEKLALCFPEIRQQLAQGTCQFSDCLHRDEPGCAISDQWERYEVYLTLLEEAEARQTVHQQQRDPESTFKVKTGEAGELQHEPLLQAKKYRRVSRRSRNQALQDLCDELTESVDDLEDLDELVFDEL